MDYSLPEEIQCSLLKPGMHYDEERRVWGGRERESVRVRVIKGKLTCTNNGGGRDM